MDDVELESLKNRYAYLIKESKDYLNKSWNQMYQLEGEAVELARKINKLEQMRVT